MTYINRMGEGESRCELRPRKNSIANFVPGFVNACC